MSYEAPDIRLLGTVADLTEGGENDRPNGSIVVTTLPQVDVNISISDT